MSEEKKYDFEIDCPHGGEDAEHTPTLPNHHPIKHSQILELLRVAYSSQDEMLSFGLIQYRLKQAIPGWTCLEPEEGPVERRADELGSYYHDNFRKARVEDFAARISQIINAKF